MTGLNRHLENVVEEAVRTVRLVDMHTHLYPPAFGPLLLRGIDDMLTYHYLVAETLRCEPGLAAGWNGLSRRDQADLVWRTLFIERSPISEACQGVLSSLRLHGLSTSERDLSGYRDYFAGMSSEEHVQRVFETVGLDYAVMTNDPFDAEEAVFWRGKASLHPRFRAALRQDGLLNDWPGAIQRLSSVGYAVAQDYSSKTRREVRRFLHDMINQMDPLYMAVSLPPSFAYPETGPRGWLLEEVILPACREMGLPLALMIGVKKRLNPSLALAGDGVGQADITSLENLCLRHPDNRFLVTLLARENQHELVVAARKFSNLMVFGCWWFLNNPGLVREITQMRLEMLGLSFIPQHSDARVLDQLLYKWEHSRRILSELLKAKYASLSESGWEPTEGEVRRDVGRLFAGNFEEFLARAKALTAYPENVLMGEAGR